jgi:hypothetical protein
VSLLGDTDTGRYVAAGLAFAAAVVSGLTKAFDLPQERSIKYAVYNLYGRWRDDLSSLARDVGHIPYDEANRRLQVLLDRRRDIEDAERLKRDPQEAGSPQEPLKHSAP